VEVSGRRAVFGMGNWSGEVLVTWCRERESEAVAR
jgi:hypothetical protein